MGDRIWKCARLKVLIGEIYRLGLGAWDKRCLKQRVNHPKIDTSVPGHRVTVVILCPPLSLYPSSSCLDRSYSNCYIVVPVAFMPSPLCRHYCAHSPTKNKLFAPSVEIGRVWAYLLNYICLLKGVFYLSDLATHKLAKSLLKGYILINCRRYRGG